MDRAALKGPMVMELRHLRNFLVVAEEGNVTRAAARLFLAQPALSRQIRELERQVGSALFERRPRGVVLTEAGHRLRPSALRAVAAFDDLLADIRSDAAGAGRGRGRRRLTIGAVTTDIAAELGAPIVAAARAALPDVVIDFRLVPFGAQQSAILSRGVDVLFSCAVPDDDWMPTLDVTTLFYERQSLLVRRGHALFDAPGVTASAAAEEPLLYMPPVDSAWMSSQLLDSVRPLDQARLVPTTSQSVTAVLGDILAGRGSSATLPRFSRFGLDRNLRLVPITDGPLVPAWVAIHRSPTELAKQVATLATTVAATHLQLVPNALPATAASLLS
jgi:DNA-binding transcriptional LysR family regulator